MKAWELPVLIVGFVIVGSGLGALAALWPIGRTGVALLILGGLASAVLGGLWGLRKQSLENQYAVSLGLAIFLILGLLLAVFVER